MVRLTWNAAKPEHLEALLASPALDGLEVLELGDLGKRFSLEAVARLTALRHLTLSFGTGGQDPAGSPVSHICLPVGRSSARND